MPPSQDLAVVACHECDLLQLLPEPPLGGKASCARCGCTLATRPADPIDRPLALCIAALVVLIVANTTPLMGLSAVGRHASTTIIGGAYQMWVEGQEITAVIVAFCAVIAPAGYLLFLLVLLLAVRRPPAPQWAGGLVRWAERMRPWAMVEVMMLGILVALIKIADLAKVEAGIGMYAVGMLMLLFPAIMSSLDAEEIWRRMSWPEPDLDSDRQSTLEPNRESALTSYSQKAAIADADADFKARANETNDLQLNNADRLAPWPAP